VRREKRIPCWGSALRSRCARPPQTRWRIARAALGVVLAPIVALVVAAALTPLPPELRARATSTESVRFHDRGGGLLREVRADDATRARWVTLDEIGPTAARAA
jgi:penicillin-binding protein 1C